MLKEGINGFCMALADSVPGVSGGTIAFIMGFYDKFIGSIHNFIFGKISEKKEALKYLAKLGIGWATGMIIAVLILSSLFESHIYFVSSLFVGFIAASIPLIVKEEKDSLKNVTGGIVFGILGIALVVGITCLNGYIGGTSMNLGNFSLGLGIRLFFVGMLAISAMFLPGISGSTILLIFGAYIPVITAVKEILGLNFSYVPCLLLFAFGILAGASTVVKGIQICLEKYRTQAVYAIIGMMIGSFYAIIKGPATLKVPQPSMNIGNFQITACFIGIVLIIGLQFIKERSGSNHSEI